MLRLKIQPQELSDGMLPYPFYVDEKGLVGRQDFWRGKPHRVLGFCAKPVAGEIDLEFSDFLNSPQIAVGMYIVVSDKEDNWSTMAGSPVHSVTPLEYHENDS